MNPMAYIQQTAPWFVRENGIPVRFLLVPPNSPTKKNPGPSGLGTSLGPVASAESSSATPARRSAKSKC